MKRWTANTLPAQSAVAWTGMLVVGLCLGGCLVGPDPEKPTVDMSASWMESSPEISVEPPEVREWWTVFGDPC